MRTPSREAVADLFTDADTTTADVRSGMANDSSSTEMPLWWHLRPALIATVIGVAALAAIAGLVYVLACELTPPPPTAVASSSAPVTAKPAVPSQNPAPPPTFSAAL